MNFLQPLRSLLLAVSLFCANAMAYKIAYHAVTGLFCMFLHFTCDLAPQDARPAFLHSDIEHTLGDVHQSLSLWPNLANADGHSRITAISIDTHPKVHAENIAILQDSFIRNSMTDHAID